MKISESAKKGFIKAFRLNPSREWPDMDDYARRDAEALRKDWIKVGEDIRNAERRICGKK